MPLCGATTDGIDSVEVPLTPFPSSPLGRGESHPVCLPPSPRGEGARRAGEGTVPNGAFIFRGDIDR
jgi:hypothetical protein